MEKMRCHWAKADNQLYLDYHDHEWGVPCHDETTLFEMLNLEGAQAGLSWETILNKRANYRAAFDNWNAAKIARYDDKKVAALLADPGIVRNRLKVAAVIANAKAYLALKKECGSLDAYLWAFVDGKPIVNQVDATRPIQAKTALSEQISKDLLRRGFKFVGPTIIYAYMQGIGMVDDHAAHCFKRHTPKSGKSAAKSRKPA